AALQLCASTAAISSSPGAAAAALTPAAAAAGGPARQRLHARLDADRVYAARWAGRAVDAANVADNLARMRNRRWVVSECARRVAGDYPGQRLLIDYGLRETARWGRPMGLPPAEGEEEGQEDADEGGLEEEEEAACASSPEQRLRLRRWWWCVRLRLLRHSDRLEALVEAQGRSFDPAAYSSFRDLPLPSAASSWAALGALGPLGVLCRHYPAALAGGRRLAVLARLPETISPRLYGNLLPRADGEEAQPPSAPSSSSAAAAGNGPLLLQQQQQQHKAPLRRPDWVESPELLRELQAAVAAAATSTSTSTATSVAAPALSAAQTPSSTATAPDSCILVTSLGCPDDDHNEAEQQHQYEQQQQHHLPDNPVLLALDPEATDAVVRILDPVRTQRLTPATLAEWCSERALQLDERAGQLEGALSLLELGWERLGGTVRGGGYMGSSSSSGAGSGASASVTRMAQLLAAARMLRAAAGGSSAAALASAGGGAAGSGAAGVGAGGGCCWRLSLRDFAGLPG
ncbi:hypothetical protein Agub_g5828, partial [Astrephomene gubernaculifera]